jgi:predicted peptidase
MGGDPKNIYLSTLRSKEMNKEWNPHNTSIHKMNKKGDPQSAHAPRMRGRIIKAHKNLYILLAPKWDKIYKEHKEWDLHSSRIDKTSKITLFNVNNDSGQAN